MEGDMMDLRELGNLFIGTEAAQQSHLSGNSDEEVDDDGSVSSNESHVGDSDGDSDVISVHFYNNDELFFDNNDDDSDSAHTYNNSHFYINDELFFYNNDDREEAEQYIFWKTDTKLREQIERDDLELTSLTIGYDRDIDDGRYSPDDWEKDGQSIGKMTNLEELHFYNTDNADIAKEVMAKFFMGIASNKSIKKMSFQKCTTYGGELYTMLVPFLCNNHNFESLGVWVDEPRDISLLSDALSKFGHLKEFFLDSDGEDVEMAEIVTALSHHTELKYLRLGWCCLTRDGTTAVASLLKDPKSKLASLDLYDFLQIDDEDVSMLADALAEISSLTELKLPRGPSILNEGWGAIFIALQKTRSKLESLQVSSLRGFLPQLATALSKQRHLKKLDLSCNYFGVDCDEWNDVFRDLETSKCMLVDLNLCGAELCDGATGYLVKILSENSLKRLDLSSISKLSRSGWESIFSAITQNPNTVLEYLNLSSCQFNDEVLIPLANTLSNNSTIKELIMAHHDHFTSEGWQTFGTLVLSSATVLEKLNLQCAYMEEETLVAFATNLTGNNKLKELLISIRDVDLVRVWTAFTRAMCNTSSIMATYNSNHSLQKLLDGMWWQRHFCLHQCVRLFMQYHSKMTPSQAARFKIIKVHFSEGFVAQPFIDMDLNVLPHALSWMGRDSVGVDGHLYGFLRSANGLSLLMNASGKTEKKRKRSE